MTMVNTDRDKADTNITNATNDTHDKDTKKEQQFDEGVAYTTAGA